MVGFSNVRSTRPYCHFSCRQKKTKHVLRQHTSPPNPAARLPPYWMTTLSVSQPDHTQLCRCRGGAGYSGIVSASLAAQGEIQNQADYCIQFGNILRGNDRPDSSDNLVHQSLSTQDCFEKGELGHSSFKIQVTVWRESSLRRGREESTTLPSIMTTSEQRKKASPPSCRKVSCKRPIVNWSDECGPSKTWIFRNMDKFMTSSKLFCRI